MTFFRASICFPRFSFFFFPICLKQIHNCSLKQFVILKFLSCNPKFSVITVSTSIDCRFSLSLRFFCILVRQVILIKTGMFSHYFMRLDLIETFCSKLVFFDRTWAGEGWALPHCLGGDRGPVPSLSLHNTWRVSLLLNIIIAHY